MSVRVEVETRNNIAEFVEELPLPSDFRKKDIIEFPFPRRQFLFLSKESSNGSLYT